MEQKTKDQLKTFCDILEFDHHDEEVLMIRKKDNSLNPQFFYDIRQGKDETKIRIYHYECGFNTKLISIVQSEKDLVDYIKTIVK